MATILPGYDFSVNEVPTFGKFIAQAKGIQLQNLQFSDLANDISFLFNSQVTLGSGASQATSLEGALWFDPSGHMWANTRVYGWWGSSGYSGPEFVQVPLFKLRLGGWDTIRAMRGDDTTNFARLPVVGDQPAADGYSPTALRRTTNFLAQDSNGPREGGYAHDTPASGIYFIVGGRGGVRFAAGSIATNTDLTYRWAMTSPTSYDQRRVDSPGSTPPSFAVGEIYGADAWQSDSGSFSGSALAWYYGRVVADTA